MEVQLLNHSDLERLILQIEPAMPDDVFCICPVSEPLLLGDAIKKQRIDLGWADFVLGWRAALEKTIHVVPCLDDACLREALFSRSEHHRVENFWPEAVERGTTPSKRVRRLVMRPGRRNDWDHISYRECDEWVDETGHG